MMRAVKAIIATIGFVFFMSAFSDRECEKHAKTHNDFFGMLAN